MTRKIRTMNAKVRSVAKPYEPAPGERLLMESHFARLAQTPAAPRLKVSDDSSGATEIAPDHPDPRMGLSLLAEALATTDVSFVVGLTSQLADAGTRRGKVGERELNFSLAVVKGAKPKDQMEAMLAAQMAAVHMATMALAPRLANVKNVAQQDSAERALSKLARTFAAQVVRRGCSSIARVRLLARVLEPALP